jgi:mRNA-degrading endonuclease RelE of RelBE toxin-antitoxin system
MSTSKKINVSYAFHKRLEEEARRLDISYKEYLEAAGMFFLSRRIDPCQYQDGQQQDLAQMLTEAVERITSLFVYQEERMLRAVHEESAKARILGELAVSHLLRLLSQNEAQLQKLQAQDQQYLAERLRKVMQELKSGP